MSEHKQITLKDGRKLAYSIYGSPSGKPIFYNHGWPSSRLEAGHLAEAAMKANGRLIATDRPGLGRSDFQPNRTLLDWPDDLCELADQLGIEQFYVMGTSGGGPYTAACAYKIPDRLLGAAIIAGLSPMTNPKTKEGMRLMNRILLPMGKTIPWLLNLVMKFMSSSMENPKTFERMLSDLPEVDKVVLTGHIADALMASGRESFAQGTQGPTHEGRIYASSWGFDLSQIHIPISIWQGTLDVNVPLSNGRLLADEIPNATGHFLEGEGHVSLLVNHGKAILEQLLQTAEGVS